MAAPGQCVSIARSGFQAPAEELRDPAEQRNRAAARSVAIDREATPGQPLTPRCIALGAARLMLQQEERRQRSGECALSVLDSLFVAAGGHYTAEGIPAPPDEPAITAVLTETVALLGRALCHTATTKNESAFALLRRLRPPSSNDSAAIQELLATVPDVGGQECSKRSGST